MKEVTLQFHPASEPPDADLTVLINDGEEVLCGWYEGKTESGHPLWFDYTGADIFEPISWAHLPGPEECLP